MNELTLADEAATDMVDRLALANDPIAVVVHDEMENGPVALAELAVAAVEAKDHQPIPIDVDQLGVDGEFPHVLRVDGKPVSLRVETPAHARLARAGLVSDDIDPGAWPVEGDRGAERLPRRGFSLFFDHRLSHVRRIAGRCVLSGGGLAGRGDY